MGRFNEATEYIVNRIEVIDWTDEAEIGRAFTKWVKDDFEVGFDIQDNGRTLKVFLYRSKPKGDKYNGMERS